jgi:hypothetical protein
LGLPETESVGPFELKVYKKTRGYGGACILLVKSSYELQQRGARREERIHARSGKVGTLSRCNYYKPCSDCPRVWAYSHHVKICAGSSFEHGRGFALDLQDVKNSKAGANRYKQPILDGKGNSYFSAFSLCVDDESF